MYIICIEQTRSSTSRFAFLKIAIRRIALSRRRRGRRKKWVGEKRVGQERAKIKPEIIVRGTPRSIVFNDYEIMLLRFRGISLQCALATRSSSTYIQRSASASTLRVLHAFTYLYGGRGEPSERVLRMHLARVQRVRESEDYIAPFKVSVVFWIAGAVESAWSVGNWRIARKNECSRVVEYELLGEGKCSFPTFQIERVLV